MSLLDLDNELDESVDSTEAAPDFVEPPNGKYRIGFKSCDLKTKESEDEDGEEKTTARINLICYVVETVEISEDETPVENGSIFSQGFQWDENGKAYFKRLCNKVLGKKAVDGASWRQLFQAMGEGGAIVPARIAIRITKGTGKNKGKEFRNIDLKIEGVDQDPEV